MKSDSREQTERIGRRLAAARKRAGLLQATVAERLGVAQTTVCGWESGERMPRAPEISQLADLYECTADYLLGRTEYPTSLPVGELLVDQRVVDRILRAKTPSDIEDLVDWQPQMISFWQIVTRGTRVRTRQQVQALTVELASHVQKVAPKMWRLYELGAEELQRRRDEWERKRSAKTDAVDS